MHSQLLPTINCSLDYVEIREGLGVDAPLVHRYCGDSHMPPALISRGNVLQLRLRMSPYVGVRFSATFNNISTGGDTMQGVAGCV